MFKSCFGFLKYHYILLYFQLPNENGMNWSCCVIVPVTSSINRSGRNCRGSGKYFGSKCDVVRNPITIVCFGIQYPAIWTSSFVMCGNDMLAEIWKINHKQTSLIFIQYVMHNHTGKTINAMIVIQYIPDIYIYIHETCQYLKFFALPTV